MNLTNRENEMESISTEVKNNSNQGTIADRDNPFQSEFLVTALELREVLREEADILRRFAGAELLWLIPRKEYLITELEWKLQRVREAGAYSLTDSDTLRKLSREINELNTSNGVFIEKSLSYWQDLLSIFMPPSYGPACEQEKRSASPPRGLSFKREV